MRTLGQTNPSLGPLFLSAPVTMRRAKGRRRPSLSTASTKAEAQQEWVTIRRRSATRLWMYQVVKGKVLAVLRLRCLLGDESSSLTTDQSVCMLACERNASDPAGDPYHRTRVLGIPGTMPITLEASTPDRALRPRRTLPEYLLICSATSGVERHVWRYTKRLCAMGRTKWDCCGDKPSASRTTRIYSVGGVADRPQTHACSNPDRKPADPT